MNKGIEGLGQKELFQRVGEICSAVTTVITAKALLDTSLKMTMDLLGANRGSLFILSDDGKELILKIAHGMKASEQKKMVKRLGEGVVGKVAAMKKPIVVEDIGQDSRFKDFKPRKSYQSPSFICAPLMLKDKLIGVINIADKQSGGNFGNEELQLLDFLSSQIALNYRRTQLYQKFKSVVKESQSLKDELGKSSEATNRLMKQVLVQDRLASIGKLTGGIAHELNNPLDGILRYINLSLEQVKEDDVVRGYLLEVKQGLNRMVNIVKNLLACSRNGPPARQKANVNVSVEEALSSVRSEIFHKKISIVKKLSNDIPEIMDMGVERVISNLLRNAIDAVPENGKIEVVTNFVDGTLVIKIGDDGCGINETALDKVFEPFYTTKEIDKGCGLGLTIVSEIVKSYNGDICIESVPEQGTIFTITLPIQTNDIERAFRI